MSVSIPFLKYAVSKDGITLKSGLAVIQDHWKWHCLIDHIYYLHSVVTVALSCIISEKAIYWPKIWFFSYPLHSMPALGWGSQSKYCHTVWYWKKSEWWKKFDDMFSRFDRISTCDRRTDKRTDILRQHSLHSKNWLLFISHLYLAHLTMMYVKNLVKWCKYDILHECEWLTERQQN